MPRRAHNRSSKTRERKIFAVVCKSFVFTRAAEQLGLPASTVRDVAHRVARERGTTLAELRKRWRLEIRRKVWAAVALDVPWSRRAVEVG